MANIEAEFSKMSLAGKSAVELSGSAGMKVGKKSEERSESDVDIYYVQIQQYTGNGDEPVSNGKLAVLCSTHHVRLFDAERLVRTSTIDGSEAQVTKVRFGHNTPDLLYTSSVDSQIRCWDFRTDMTKPASTFKAKDNKGAAFLSFDLTCNDKFLCAGTKVKSKDAVVYFWDHREPESGGCYEDLHSDDITQVKFHPSRQDSLLTAGDDGLVNYLDISQPNEEEALQYTLDTTSTPDKIGWLTDDEAYITTFCNTAYIWETSTGDESAKKELSQFQNEIKTNKVNYLVDCFLDNNDSPTMLTGNDRSDGMLFSLRPECPSYLGSLPSAHSDWIRACCYNKKSKCLYTVGEDALLCCWRPSHLTKDDLPQRSSKASRRTKSAADRKPYSKP